MKPTTEILARISQNSLANKEEVFTKLYRYLLRPDIYFVAYKNLYANNGAATKGVNEDTACYPAFYLVLNHTAFNQIKKRHSINYSDGFYIGLLYAVPLVLS